MQCLRTEHQINIGSTSNDFLTFLRSHASAYANKQVGIAFFQGSVASEFVKDLFLRLLSDGACIDQDEIRLVCRVDLIRLIRGLQQIEHS